MISDNSSPVAIDEHGWHRHARLVRSPNFDARPSGAVPEIVVVHCISLPRGGYGNGLVERLFANQLDCGIDASLAGLEGQRLSAHFLIDRLGRLTQFVSCRERAWHAGVSSHRGRGDCNGYSIGVELEGCDDARFSAAQYRRLAALAAQLMARYSSLDAQSLLGHQHIAAGRKGDPGAGFDWSRLARQLAPPWVSP